MLKEFYQQIMEDVKPEIIELDGREYSTGRIYPVEAPRPGAFAARTLTSMVDYINANVDKLEIDKLICHVESPTEVCLMSSLNGAFMGRDVYMRLKADTPSHNFDKFVISEAFIIWLQSCFCECAALQPEYASDRQLVLQYAGNMRNEEIATSTDDGITQGVSVRKGIASAEVVALPNPVYLRPFRTFVEIEQPASPFILRAKKAESRVEDCSQPYLMLTEADGGAWRNEVMRAIKAYFNEKLPELLVIA